MPIRSFEEAKNLNNNIVIGKARPEDAQAFVNLVNKQYQRKKNKDFFQWMFMNTSFPAGVITAYDNDVPVAFYGMQILKLNSGVNCGLSVEIIIDEKYRGRGLFVLLENEASNFAASHNSAAVTVFGNYNGMKAHDNLKTWKTIAKIDTLIFDCKNKLMLNNNFNNKTAGLELTSYFKDTNYRNWRFNSSPVYNYEWIGLSENIFAVTKIFKDPQNKTIFGDIVDFNCDLNNPPALKELYVKSCRHLINQKVNYITSWALPHTILCDVLISLGFKPVPQERYFSVRIIKPGYEYLNDIKSWHLVESDSEVY